MTNLSLCSLAMLAVVVDAPVGATSEALRIAVPPHVRRDEMPGEIDEWPHDLLEWLEELQTLLDRNFVRRVATRRAYVYVATPDGVVMLKAALHPRGNTWESVA